MAFCPVDVMIVGFPGNKFSGRIAPALMELVDSSTIRIIDLLFVSKDANGVITTIEAARRRRGTRAGLPGNRRRSARARSARRTPRSWRRTWSPTAPRCYRVREHLGEKVVEAAGTPDAVVIDQSAFPRTLSTPSSRRPSRPTSDTNGVHDMGLLRMAARTAVVAGTATAVSGRVARRQARSTTNRSRAAGAAPSQPRRKPRPLHQPRRRMTTWRSFSSWRNCTARECYPMRSSQQPRPRS